MRANSASSAPRNARFDTRIAATTSSPGRTHDTARTVSGYSGKNAALASSVDQPRRRGGGTRPRPAARWRRARCASPTSPPGRPAGVHGVERFEQPDRDHRHQGQADPRGEEHGQARPEAVPEAPPLRHARPTGIGRRPDPRSATAGSARGPTPPRTTRARPPGPRRRLEHPLRQPAHARQLAEEREPREEDREVGRLEREEAARARQHEDEPREEPQAELGRVDLPDEEERHDDREDQLPPREVGLASSLRPPHPGHDGHQQHDGGDVDVPTGGCSPRCRAGTNRCPSRRVAPR